MVRATLWTVGLFGAGTMVCRLFPGSGWTEPLVLIALGLAFLFVSARTGLVSGRADLAQRSGVEQQGRTAQVAVEPAPPKVVAVTPVPATAPVQVERTA